MKKTIVFFTMLIAVSLTLFSQENTKYVQDTIFLKIGVPVACDIIGMSEYSININYLDENGQIGFSQIPNDQIKKAHKRSIVININNEEPYESVNQSEQYSQFGSEQLITKEKPTISVDQRNRMRHIGLITTLEYGSPIWRFGGSFSYIGKRGVGFYLDGKYGSEKEDYYYGETTKIKFTTLNGGMAFRLGNAMRMYTALGGTRIAYSYNDNKNLYTTAALGFLFGNRRSGIGGQLGFETIFMGSYVWSSVIVGITVNF